MAILEVILMILIGNVVDTQSKIFINNNMTSFIGEYISWDPSNINLNGNCNAIIDGNNGVKLQCNSNSYNEAIVLMTPIDTRGYNNFIIKFEIKMNGILLSHDDTCGAYYSINNGLSWNMINVYDGNVLNNTQNIVHNCQYIDDKPSVLIKFEINAKSDNSSCNIKNIVLSADEINNSALTFKQFFKSKQSLYGVISTSLIIISCCICIFLYIVNKQLKKIRREIKEIRKKQNIISTQSTPSIKPVKSSSVPINLRMNDDDDDDNDIKSNKILHKYHNRYETNSGAMPMNNGGPIITELNDDNDDDYHSSRNPTPIITNTVHNLKVHDQLHKGLSTENTPLSVLSPISPLSGINGHNNIIAPQRINTSINGANDTSSDESSNTDTEFDSE